MRFFALELPSDMVARDGGALRLAPGAVSAASRRSRLAEQIGATRFVPWYDATRVGDLFTVAAVARLLDHRRASSPAR